MASVKLLFYDHKTLKDGTHPIVLSIIKDRKRKIISLGYSAKTNQWNFDKNIPNAKHEHAEELRSLLKTRVRDAEKIIIELDEAGKPYTLDNIVERISEARKKSSFKEYTEDLIQKMKKTGEIGNANVYRNTMIAFLYFLNEPDIDFKNINNRKLNEFRENLLANDRKINTVSFYLRTIRAIYNKAIKDNIVSDKYYPFKDFKIRNEKTIKRAISKETISDIKNLDLSDKKHLDLARDMFLFSFYNRGMNFIDIFYLKEKDIVEGRIIYRRKKTRQTFTIKVTDNANKIIEQYIQNKGPDYYVFPIIKNGNEYTSYRTATRNLNKYLKEIGKLVNTTIPLTSYVARHSWATIAKRSGIATVVISEGLGHDSEQTTQIYLDSFEDDVLDKANELITNL